jgi:FixJ family two-component response regulator
VTVLNAIKADVDVSAILVVDDEADWIEECQFMLESFGYPSMGATNVADALTRIADRSITTVIVDYNMPGRDGISLIGELSAIAAADGRELRFIMATGHATLDVAVGALRASVVDFLSKPINRDDLRASLLRVHGVRSEAPVRGALAAQLSGLSAEMQRLSSLIGDPGFGTPGDRGPAAGGAAQIEHKPAVVDSDYLRGLLRKESKRRNLGNGTLFGDPAWAMLLDLLIAKLDRRNVSVSSACIASGAPTTTALRLVNRLVSEDILHRVPDERDGRRDFLVINPEIETPLLAYLSEVANS